MFDRTKFRVSQVQVVMVMKPCVAVFLPNWIGDVVMATPTLRNLRQHVGPSWQILGVMRPYLRDVLSGNSWLDETICYDPRSKQREYHGKNVIASLRQHRVDDIFLLTNSWRSAWIAWQSGAQNRIGYARNFRSPFLTTRLTPPRVGWKYEPISAVDYYLRTIQSVGVQISSRQPELYTTAVGEKGAALVWKAFGWDPHQSVIGLNTGGAYGAAKHWPNSHAGQLASRLAEEGQKVLILCGPKEVDAAREIESLARHPSVRSMADQDLSLEVSKSSLRRLRLLVTTDSGPRHMATAFDVPTVTLFGPIDPKWSRNYASYGIEMFDQLACSPCGRRVCPLGHHRCMNELTPDRVHAAVRALLRRAAAA